MPEREMPKDARDDLFKGMYCLPKVERLRRIDAFEREVREQVAEELEENDFLLAADCVRNGGSDA